MLWSQYKPLYKLPYRIRYKAVTAVLDEIDSVDLRARVESARRNGCHETIGWWSASCKKLIDEFEKNIKPHTELRDFELRNAHLCYYHKKDRPSGIRYINNMNDESLIIVTICLAYNSRFAQWIQRSVSGGTEAPSDGVYGEVVLAPGEILVCDGEMFMFYPTGHEGELPTIEEVEEGQDGGFSIFLVYNRSAGKLVD